MSPNRLRSACSARRSSARCRSPRKIASVGYRNWRTRAAASDASWVGSRQLRATEDAQRKRVGGKWCEVVDRSNNDALQDAALSVLVVDGNPASRERVREALGAQCVVRFASGVREALLALHTQPPDLLVSE